MICERCGHSMPDGSLTCDHCGAYLGKGRGSRESGVQAMRQGRMNAQATPVQGREGGRAVYGDYDAAPVDAQPQARASRPKPVASGSPLLVPLVEAGRSDPADPEVASAVEECLRDVRAAGVDTLILGCTHFPLLSEAIAAYMGEGVTLIDSGAAGARALAALLEKNSLRSPRRSFGRTACYASGDPVEFARVAELFLRRDMSNTVFKTAVL